MHEFPNVKPHLYLVIVLLFKLYKEIDPQNKNICYLIKNFIMISPASIFHVCSMISFVFT